MVAAATMIWGNLAALMQTNVKRMFAYSSIAHAGFLITGFIGAHVVCGLREAGWEVGEEFVELGGKVLGPMVKRSASDAKVTSVVGIEESPEMAAVAREHIACAGWDNVTVVQAPAEDAADLPAPAHAG